MKRMITGLTLTIFAFAIDYYGIMVMNIPGQMSPVFWLGIAFLIWGFIGHRRAKRKNKGITP